VAALVRAGAVRISIEQKVYTNPEDGTLQDALREAAASIECSCCLKRQKSTYNVD